MHAHPCSHMLIVVTMRIHGSELCVREDGGDRKVCVRLSHIVATAIQFELRLHSGTAQSKCIPSACCIGHITWCDVDLACTHICVHDIV